MYFPIDEWQDTNWMPFTTVLFRAARDTQPLVAWLKHLAGVSSTSRSSRELQLKCRSYLPQHGSGHVGRTALQVPETKKD